MAASGAQGNSRDLVLVTGATGYIGGRLVPKLLELGHRVRVFVRDPLRVSDRSWVDQVEVVSGDLLQPETLVDVFEGVSAAYYLVHSMHGGSGFSSRDRQAAHNFCEAAEGLAHVIYVGGLVPRRRSLTQPRGSEHLRSRAEVGLILARSLPTTEFRSGPIIGSGSASFEMLRYVTERFPIMFAPSWIINEVAPIAIRDVLQYLTLALKRGPSGVIEIGARGKSYKEMMLDYASARKLKRWILPIPHVMPSWFGAGWIGMLTPIPDGLARPLMQSMAQPLRPRRFRAERCFPEVIPLGYKDAVRLALNRIQVDDVVTRWSDASGSELSYFHRDSEGMMRDERSVHVEAAPGDVYRTVSGLGGGRGWLSLNWLWKSRGLIDRLLGGPGLVRGRRHRDQLLLGEAVDFWRVEALQRPGLLRLRGEAKLPGRAWLQWTLSEEGKGTTLIQSAAFAPRGLQGVLYWYLLYPLHRLIFRALVRDIKHLAEHPVKPTLPLAPFESGDSAPSRPPRPVRGVMGDVLHYLIHTPRIPTRLDFSSIAEREDYSKRILQRVGRDVSGYSVLNVHQIGIDAPGRYVFEELLQWDSDALSWPNELATIERVGGGLSHLKVHLFGRSWLRHLRWKRTPLFEMKLLRQQAVPGNSDTDNSRYLLFSCEGGYPIGILALYVRSSIPEQGEVHTTQVFLGVGFDFYGRETWPLFHPFNRVWEVIHDRATRNQLNRLKQLCEWKFARTREDAPF